MPKTVRSCEVRPESNEQIDSKQTCDWRRKDDDMADRRCVCAYGWQVAVEQELDGVVRVLEASLVERLSEKGTMQHEAPAIPDTMFGAVASAPARARHAASTTTSNGCNGMGGNSLTMPVIK